MQKKCYLNILELNVQSLRGNNVRGQWIPNSEVGQKTVKVKQRLVFLSIVC